MKFSSIGRASLASLLSLSACLGVTACSRNYTVAFLYVAATSTSSSSGNNGVVNIYNIDYQSGALLQLPESASTSGQNPTALVVTADQKNLYVANGDTASVSPFRIGTDGKLYMHDQKSLSGSFPVAMALSGDNKYLYVLTRLHGGNVTTGTGQIEIYPVNTDSTLGTATIVNVGLNPVGIVASADNKYVYVIHRDVTNTQNTNLIGFSRTSSGGLTPLPGVTITATGATGFGSGVEPSSIVEDPKSRYLYVTDRVSNHVIGYSFNSNGVPVAMNNGPFATGSYPTGSTIDPRGKYLYVTNYNDNSVSAYALDPATGNLSASTGSVGVQTGTGPTCVTVENALGLYLYTSNRLDSTVTGLQLNASTGALKNIQGTPFSTSSLPACAVAVANGEHATQIVQ